MHKQSEVTVNEQAWLGCQYFQNKQTNKKKAAADLVPELKPANN